MKLWQKDNSSSKEVETFTVANDREMDLYLAVFDVIGSLAHIEMLESVGLLSKEDRLSLSAELKNMYKEMCSGSFQLEAGVEDIHSQVELLLTRNVGEAGKKIHMARSRNDQVLVDIKLFLRNELQELVAAMKSFFELLQEKSEQHQDDLLPGYTHLQLAMPSSFGLWFGAYAESLVDDLVTIKAAFDITNKNPLGSAAGYGSSFPIDRKLTTDLLGFDDLNYNVVYAQMGRGKTERIVAQALSNLAETMAKLSMDICLYMNENFGFIRFPGTLTTGSSIMPHKKNPDAFELIRAKCNRIKALPNEITILTTNLPSGYHRDLQLLKEHLFPSFRELKDCLRMAEVMLSSIEINKNLLDEERYRFLFSVEEVNKLVQTGMPFRDAYLKIGNDIESGHFKYEKQIHHTHQGSIGNLCNNEIRRLWDKIWASFPFDNIEKAVSKLLS